MRKITLLIIVFLFPIISFSQTVTCNGVLGAPIVSFDFGQGNNNQTWYSPLATYAPNLTTNTIFLSAPPLSPGNTSSLVKNSSTFGSSQW